MDLQLTHTQETYFRLIAAELNIKIEQVASVANLLEDGATIPFIARYRKEVTGSLDEVAIANIRDRLTQLKELEARRQTILKSIQEQGKLTDELKTQIEAAQTMSVLEDLYLPYKPKRRTRATIAREKGLEPLSERIFSQENFDIEKEASLYISEEKNVKDIEEALAGARDIIAEKVNEDAIARASIRNLFFEKGYFSAKVIEGKEEEGQKYKDYFEWSEPIRNAPSHRVLALRRAEAEGIISLNLNPEEEEAIQKLENQFVKAKNKAAEQVKLAIRDAYKRLLKSSIENEVRLATKKQADEEAIKVFADNLRQILIAPPMGQKRTLAIDPGFRTGCKVVCLDAQGQLLMNDVIFPDRRTAEAEQLIKDLCKKYDIEAIAIGNGTAGRETEAFIRSLKLDKVAIVMVNESGASVYSASEVAREEFPDHDLTVKGAVSIGRRLQDPLAELVKIDPKSIGVGQYQHDVDQNLLKNSLDDTVMSCVNAVGVELNTASKQLLMYVSGLGPTLAKNIVEYRNKNGAFKTREDLKKVPRLGEKAFEQCAGFLRIQNSPNPLDASAVHPESYTIVERMAKDLGCQVNDLIKNAEIRKKINIKNYVTENVGLPTLTDIMAELAKPGRDPREKFEVVEFAQGINKPEDLRIGMKLNGIITNITNFGVFVDIGVHQDGLVHISQLANKYVENPLDVVKVQQKVSVTVMEVDLARKRISLSMKDEVSNTQKNTQKKENQHKPNHTKSFQTSSKPKKNENEEEDYMAKLKALQEKFKK
jgi:uncharacterized protein